MFVFISFESTGKQNHTYTHNSHKRHNSWPAYTLLLRCRSTMLLHCHLFPCGDHLVVTSGDTQCTNLRWSSAKTGSLLTRLGSLFFSLCLPPSLPSWRRLPAVDWTTVSKCKEFFKMFLFCFILFLYLLWKVHKTHTRNDTLGNVLASAYILPLHVLCPMPLTPSSFPSPPTWTLTHPLKVKDYIVYILYYFNMTL